ncbi:MAG TPA: hypothetical protein VHK26_00430, partial [Methyloceanibacter sp.]|nr:hypothetical protein [Methyloceanibacter sp.]
QILGKRLGVIADIRLKDHVDALNLAFELLILGAIKGRLSEKRIKQFWIQDIPRLDKKSGDSQVAIDAFTTLTLAGLASIDPLKLTQWMKGEADQAQEEDEPEVPF